MIFMRLFRRSAKSRQRQKIAQPKQTYAHHWDHPRAYTVAMLLIIGMLIVPIYAGLTAEKTGNIIFADSPVQEQPALNDRCTDTDGRDYTEKGIVTARSGGSDYSFEDSCSGSVLKEYRCNGNRMASELKKCANGCADGRCVP
jgi:hypothetical protein